MIEMTNKPNRGGVERTICIPTTRDGCAPAITAVYSRIGAANLLGVEHYPKMGVQVIYERDNTNSELDRGNGTK